MSERRLPKHSVTIAGHATSISLEAEFWQALQQVALAENKSLPALLAALDAARLQQRPAPSLASAARLYVLRHCQAQLRATATTTTAGQA